MDVFMDYIHVKNIEKYHPSYKDRKLSWCKVFFSCLDTDNDFMFLPEIDQWRFFKFVIIELQTQKHIPVDPRLLAHKGFDLKNRPISITLQMLHAFLDTVTEPLQNRDVEKRREEKRRVCNVPEKEQSFNQPTQEEITSYLKEQDVKDPSEGARFFDFYESKGWMVGKNKMKDWKAACRNWKRGMDKNGRESKKNPWANCQSQT